MEVCKSSVYVRCAYGVHWHFYLPCPLLRMCLLLSHPALGAGLERDLTQNNRVPRKSACTSTTSNTHNKTHEPQENPGKTGK